MKFVHVNHRYAPFVGGSERWVQEVSEALVLRDHSVSVITTDAFDLEYLWDRHRVKVDAPAREDVAGVNVVRVPVRHLPLSSIGFRGSRRLMGEASGLPIPSIVFRAMSPVQPYIPGFERAVGHEMPADLVLGTNLGIESLAIRSRKVSNEYRSRFVLTPFIHLGVDGDPIARRYVSMPHQRELLAAADAVLVMTDVEKEFVEHSRGNRGNVFVTGAGVTIGEVTGGSRDRFMSEVGAAGFVVGAVGAMARDKGTIDLAQAVIALRRQGFDVQLVLIGPPLQAFVRWYSGLSQPDQEGLHVLGFVSAEFKRDALAAIDVMALPSRTESFGIVYLEAWANRKPVIAADTPATRELIDAERTGLLVPFGSVEGIADAILRLMSAPELRAAIGLQGYEQTLRRHTWDRVVERVTAAYSDVLGIDVSGGCER